MASIFVKLGGSFVTDKKKTETLKGENVEAAARSLRAALDEAAAEGKPLSIVLAHGAGSFGHIHALEYAAVAGEHPEKGWEGFHKIRASMARMNALFLERCARGGLNPVTVQPSAVASAEDGRVARLDAGNIRLLLDKGQIPLIHGDIVPDAKRGFTIASTEALLAALVKGVSFNRIVMVADTDGVLDEYGETIPEIGPKNFNEIAKHLGVSGSPDVTGGMKEKVEGLLRLAASAGCEARILAGTPPDRLRRAVLGQNNAGGTRIIPAKVQLVFHGIS